MNKLWSRRSVLRTSVGAAAAMNLPLTWAQATSDYPNRPVRLVLGVPAGQGSDTTARALARQLNVFTGQPFIIENLPGANQAIGARAVARSAPDGYTFFLGSQASMAANMAYYKDAGFDAIKQFSPVCLISSSDWVIIVSGQSPYNTLNDVLVASRKDPKLLSIGVYGSSTQLGAALFAQAAGVEANIILYKGSPQVVQDVAGQQLVMGLVEKSSALALTAAGKIKPLAAISDKRVTQMLDVPTVRELNLSMPILNSWIGVFAPAGTTKDLREQMALLVKKAIAAEEFGKMLSTAGFQATYKNPDELAAFQLSEIEKYRQAMIAGSIQPQ